MEDFNDFLQDMQPDDYIRLANMYAGEVVLKTMDNALKAVHDAFAKKGV